MKNVTLFKFEDWLRNKNLKETTIKNYGYIFNKFIILDGFTQETVSQFLSKNRDSNHRGFLMNFKRYLVTNYKELEISKDLRMDIMEVEIPKATGRTKLRIIKPLTFEEIGLIEKCLDTEELKLQLLLTSNCGLRLGELLKVKILSFNWEIWKKNPLGMGECRVFGKGDKEGIALVPSSLMKRIAGYIRSNPKFKIDSHLFNVRESRIMNIARDWQRKLREAGIKAGVTKVNEKGEVIEETAVFPHRLRHSYANYLLNEKKLNIREVQELMRHSSITSTEVYTYVDKEKLKEKLAGEL